MISPNVISKNVDGKPITGGQVFQKSLLNHGQEDFKCGWATKASEDAAVKKHLVKPSSTQTSTTLCRTLYKPQTST